MEDKIRCFILSETYKIIENDAESFGFIKPSGEINKNSFVNKLISNYYNDYNNYKLDVLNKINSILNKKSLKNGGLVAEEILNTVFSTKKDNNGNFVYLDIKPTKQSIKELDLIKYNNQNIALSAYLRNMLYDYSVLSQYKREEIIFKNEINTIKQAINTHKKIMFRKDGTQYIVSPYKISAAKDESNNYLLCEWTPFDSKYKTSPTTFRISKLENINILSENATFTSDSISLFKKIDKYDPSIAYNYTDTIIKIKLTEDGIKRFNRSKYNKPTPIKIDGNEYFFDCSTDQIKRFFLPFGPDLVVLEPKDLRESFISFYKGAYKNYSSN